jgi:hypothetical protein
VQHCNVEIDDLYLGHGEHPKVAHIHKAYGMIGQSKKSRNSWYMFLVHITYCEDYEEGSGENDTSMDLLHFGDNKNWSSSLVGAQLDDLDCGLSEGMEALDVGGRHLGSQCIQCGLYEGDIEEYKLDDFWIPIVV